MPRAAQCSLFPYTTLYRSVLAERSGRRCGSARGSCHVRLPPKAQTMPEATRYVQLAEACRMMPQQYDVQVMRRDRKSTRLNSSHLAISYAVFCLKKKIS